MEEVLLNELMWWWYEQFCLPPLLFGLGEHGGNVARNGFFVLSADDGAFLAWPT